MQRPRSGVAAGRTVPGHRRTALAQAALAALLTLSATTALAPSVTAGSAASPEVTDPSDDAFDPPGPLIDPPAELELTAGWYAYTGPTTFDFTIRVQSFVAWVANTTYTVRWCEGCNDSVSGANRFIEVAIDSTGPASATCGWSDDPSGGLGNATNRSSQDPMVQAEAGSPGTLRLTIERTCTHTGADGTMLNATTITTAYSINGTPFPGGQVDTTDAAAARSWTLGPEPIAPVHLDPPSGVTIDGLTLSWSQSQDDRFERYDVHLATTAGFSPSEATLLRSITDPGSHGLEVDGLHGDTTYYGKVEVVASDGSRAISNEVSAHTLPPTSGGPTDTDGDGKPDSDDSDDDNDGYDDAVEQNQGTDPLDPNDTPPDLVADGTPDTSDPDDDDDGVSDGDDEFPRDDDEWADNDRDGTGDNGDRDDDNDGTADTDDAFPTDGNEQRDTDHDGQGDKADGDDDGDKVADGQDAFPLDPKESIDTDKDGTGDNADTDDDGDGASDTAERDAGSDPLDPASKPQPAVPKPEPRPEPSPGFEVGAGAAAAALALALRRRLGRAGRDR